MVLLQIGPNTLRQEVVKRDDDILTPAQLKEHWPDVQKAMLKELQTWAELRCFSRKSRREARNIIDVRWVIKFKWECPERVPRPKLTSSLYGRYGHDSPCVVSKTSRRQTSIGMLGPALEAPR